MTFEMQLAAMTTSILSGRSKRAAAMLLLPNEAHERSIHAACMAAGTSCSCRVCYWSKGR